MEKYSENRPWGKFEKFTNNEISTVKIITVEPNQQLSLQYHHKRDEFWRVVSGKAFITIGEETKEAKEDDEFFIPRLAKHRITTKDSKAKIMEISFGVFDENDIVRLEDKYKRA
jgi:mannose-1-phosphate guanylyltransferase/mannose-1-phosphate guanylyltransferase/mannose-6-phosphate isomerase